MPADIKDANPKALMEALIEEFKENKTSYPPASKIANARDISNPAKNKSFFSICENFIFLFKVRSLKTF